MLYNKQEVHCLANLEIMVIICVCHSCSMQLITYKCYYTPMHYVYNVLMLYVSCIVHTLEHVVSFLSCYVHTSSHVYMPICPVMLACHQFTITSYDRL